MLQSPLKSLLQLAFVCLIPRLASSLSATSLVPEVTEARLSHVSNLVATALGDTAGHKDDRYESARSAALALEEREAHELVYGELSIPVLATILDAVGVQEGDRFLDIGSGDGALVLGTSLLYANNTNGENAIQAARGLEIVPGLYQRSLQHQKSLDNALRQDLENEILLQQQAAVEFVLGDIHDAPTDESLKQVLLDTTLAVCFATTWSAGNVQAGKKNSLQGRRLDALSRAMSLLPTGARMVVVDGRLDQKDGHEWEGDLKVDCPDTTPSSVASLYIKV